MFGSTCPGFFLPDIGLITGAECGRRLPPYSSRVLPPLPGISDGVGRVVTAVPGLLARRPRTAPSGEADILFCRSTPAHESAFALLRHRLPGWPSASLHTVSPSCCHDINPANRVQQQVHRRPFRLRQAVAPTAADRECGQLLCEGRCILRFGRLHFSVYKRFTDQDDAATACSRGVVCCEGVCDYRTPAK